MQTRFLLLLLILAPPTSASAQLVWTRSGQHFAKFSPDGTYLATSTHDGSIKVLNVATGSEVLKFAVPEDYGVNPHVAISPNNAYLASYNWKWNGENWENFMILWDMDSGKESTRLIGHSDQILSIAFSPDGTYLASRSCDEIRLWDVAKGLEVRRIIRPERIPGPGRQSWCVSNSLVNGVLPITFAPNGYLAGGERDTVRLWDVTTGQEVHKFILESRPIQNLLYTNIYSMNFSPDGTYLALSTEEVYHCCFSYVRIRMWNMTTDKEASKFGFPSRRDIPPSATSFSPDGSYFAEVFGASRIVFYETKDWKYAGQVFHDLHGSYRREFGDISRDMRFVSALGTGGVNLVTVHRTSSLTLHFEETIQNQNYLHAAPIDPLVLPRATGGDGTIIYTLEPDLPVGLFFHGPARTIFGVPAAVTSNPTEYTYTATDTRGLTASLSFEISVVQPVFTEKTTSLPTTFTVISNYPNPFRDETQVMFDLPWPARVRVEVMDVAGRLLLNFPEYSLAAGRAQTMKIYGASLPAGLYLYRLIASSAAGSFVQVRQLVKVQ